MSSSAPSAASDLNLAVIAGRLSSPPRTRDLPSGTRLVNLEVRVDHDDRAADTVPVACFDPPAAVDGLATGDAVVVVGRVRRRFFRAGGRTASSTEVVAGRVVPAGRRAGVRRAVQGALDDLTARAT